MWQQVISGITDGMFVPQQHRAWHSLIVTGLVVCIVRHLDHRLAVDVRRRELVYHDPVHGA